MTRGVCNSIVFAYVEVSSSCGVYRQMNCLGHIDRIVFVSGSCQAVAIVLGSLKAEGGQNHSRGSWSPYL